MSDIYVPGVKSRFNTEKIIEDLMRVERIPRDRAEKDVENLQTEKTYWQEVGRRIGSLRDSAKLLYSFQNPFNDRIVVSQDESVISGTATREAVEQERSFQVTQIARADRFLSSPLEESFRVEAGAYGFSVGNAEISLTFRGGSLREFTEAINRRGQDKIRASLITVEPGTKSLLIESLLTGADNRLGFSADAGKLAVQTGLVETVNDSSRDIAIHGGVVRGPQGETNPPLINLAENTIRAGPGGRARIYIGETIPPSSLVLRFEAATELQNAEEAPIPQPPPGPSIPGTGTAAYGGVTVENELSSVPLPPWTPPEPPKRVDDLGILSLNFSDGTSALVPPIRDSDNFNVYQYPLSDLTGGKSIVSMELINNNTHRDVSVRDIRVFDPGITGGVKPRNPVSTAQDAIVVMDGIEVKRPVNQISDLVPGVTLTAKAPSDRPVRLRVEPDRESIKDAIISLTGNYNRLMAELNVLTRNDDRIVEELSYLNADEQADLRKRLGSFSGDSSLNQLKNNLQRAASTPYPTSEDRSLALLAQIGIGTDVRRTGASAGYDVSRLRGYLEIDEKALDAALDTYLPAIQQFFGSDTDGDLITDSGLSFALENLSKPYVEPGGLISLKTGTIDSQISQEQRRIETLDRQLALKEADLKIQYGQMEGAYNRMERMSTSLEQFSQRANNNR
ncbi:MAG: flagellar filament capping protein FliD [Spirochaetaceae bacterium]|jgi:flagellar hook-associated protein 2|nr:flagellar filament capping protein FliD [Spirochaetaceae bacterium]